MYSRLAAKRLVLVIVAIAFGLICISTGKRATTQGQPATSLQTPAKNPHSFIGTWVVQAQITDCAQTTLEDFTKFVSVHQGGTANEVSRSVPPSQRTVAFGVWEHLNQRNFVYALRFFRFTPAGTFANTVEAKWSVLMDESGDSYAADGAIKVRAPNGTVVASLCGVETGTRMTISE